MATTRPNVELVAGREVIVERIRETPDIGPAVATPASPLGPVRLLR